MSDGPQLETEVHDAVLGSVIAGRFQIQSLLGRGGMGAVYLATHLQLDKPVALKLMHGSWFLDKHLRERFVREVKVCSALNHPNIIKILSTGVSPEGQPYVAMDFIQGETLTQRLASCGALKSAQALPLLLQIADALACAHSSGVAHRDVKPGNVMLTEGSDGSAKALVVDFGLSKFISDEGAKIGSQMQTTSGMQGSPLYMSPEQCQNQKTDFRTDVYSLGCLMYEMLSGKPPFEGDSVFALMYEHVNALPPPFDPSLSVPNALQNVVFRCLEKLPENRYATAGDIVTALADKDSEPAQRNPASRYASTKPKTGASRRLPSVVLVALGLVGVFLMPFIGIQQVSMVPNDETAREIGLLLDRLGFFDAEVRFYTKYAERKLEESAFKPTKISKFDPRYDKVSAFSQFTVYAVQAATKAEPGGQAELATQSFLNLRQLVRADENGNMCLSKDTYHQVLRDNVTTMKLIPNIDATYTGVVGPEGIGLGQMLDFESMNDEAEWVLLRSLSIIKRTNRESWNDLGGVTYWLADNYLNRGTQNGVNVKDLELALFFYDQTCYYRRKRYELPQYQAVIYANKAHVLSLLKRFDEAKRLDDLAMSTIGMVNSDPKACLYYWAEVIRVISYGGDPQRLPKAQLMLKQAEQAVAEVLKRDPHAFDE